MMFNKSLITIISLANAVIHQSDLIYLLFIYNKNHTRMVVSIFFSKNHI
ncbi:hypothetical protein VAEU17_280010 [Vibrio aestuarianus]|nr:hypothetical protein VAEU17_280010 [Vibrio aestuarianus]